MLSVYPNVYRCVVIVCISILHRFDRAADCDR